MILLSSSFNLVPLLVGICAEMDSTSRSDNSFEVIQSREKNDGSSNALVRCLSWALSEI